MDESPANFVDMPDFAYATSTGPFVQEYTDKVVPMRCTLTTAWFWLGPG